MTAKDFYKELYGEDAPKNFENSSSLHIFGFAEAYAEHLKQVKNIAYEPVLATGRKCIHAICSKDDCPFVMNDEIECPLH